MYLVHVYLSSHPAGELLPGHTASVMTAVAEGRAEVVHVAVHADTAADPVIGVYLRAASLHAAEASTRALWSAARAAHPWLDGWQLLRAEVPMLPVPEW
ncbi:hypothetical protein J7F03_12280 [Streptomyces sp. ISL-43]|uniref:hypothetical protein n=1 Tax=Streptomyces sp. ISL-43 TaxID=2819183 RepID=UPI001BEC5680|nr:hypothetical protein [Streptomyces sp. ISL-43]MBT2447837.1 hypothetical protein [Streptomyces sp. ISL-43]